MINSRNKGLLKCKYVAKKRTKRLLCLAISKEFVDDQLARELEILG
jgi:hypothetical protein